MTAGTCEDVDECAEAGQDCAFRCHNTLGSYKCVCPFGYQLAPDGKHCRGGEGGCYCGFAFVKMIFKGSLLNWHSNKLSLLIRITKPEMLAETFFTCGQCLKFSPFVRKL